MGLTFETKQLQFLGDRITPVSFFLKLRDRSSMTFLLESTDFRGLENSVSYLCAFPIARLAVQNGNIEVEKNGVRYTQRVVHPRDVWSALKEFQREFHFSSLSPASNLYGYLGYHSIPYWEDIQFCSVPPSDENIPALSYTLFEFVVEIDHYREIVTIYHNKSDASSRSLEDFASLLSNYEPSPFPFETVGFESSNLSDEEHQTLIERCKEHIFRGDVFQIVPSRKFRQGFQGDEFQVYRALRSVNPSPYLFYFDFGIFRLFGSSPELQLLIKNQRATIHPIAGTYPRGSDDASDQRMAERLREDPKENAEHVMLVDLARNDLSRHCDSVTVEQFQEVEFYSHVIHLVSKVTGSLRDGTDGVQILADTFPAGTLSGAPKYKAMQLLNQYEKGARSFYGGGLGFLRPNGDLLHAIMIRSFLSINGALILQAGSGIVADSVASVEVLEVRNKLGALRRAITVAETL